jgi:hypothetical protein
MVRVGLVDVSGDLGWSHRAGAVLIEGPLANNRRSAVVGGLGGWAAGCKLALGWGEVRVDVS